VALAGSARPVPVSFQTGAVVVAPGVHASAIRDDLERLDATVPTMRELASEHDGVLFLQFTALEDGARITYPGIGNFPPGYDSRNRSWYRAAKRVRRRIWTPPIFSATTNQLTFITAMPVYAPGDRFAGVAAVEIAIVDLLQNLTRSDGVSGGAGGTTILVQPTATGTLRVLAERTNATAAGAWRVRPTLPTYAGLPFAPIVADVRARRSGIARLTDRGTDQLWIYAPVPTLDAALVQRLPYAAVRAAAAASGESLRHEATRQVQLSGVVASIMVVLVALTAIVVAGTATRPIRALAAVARRLGAGDFDARADARGNDEIAALGRAFNAMVPRLQDGLRMQQSLELARAVQQNLLPLRPPAIAGFDIAGASEYCDETGGDYYDFVDLSHNGKRRVAIAVGDVSGHGIASALVMASARAALRGAIDATTTPSLVIDRANALLCDDITDGSFMTLVLLVVDPASGAVRWVNAAHDAPLVYHVPSGTFVPLPGSDIPLGIDAGWGYSEHTAAIPAGEVLIALGTDGIWETENAAGEAFGRGRWERLVRENHALPAADICGAILGDVAAFRGGGNAVDDVTLVIIKYTAAAVA
jgi:sigma-B regulation protein RsbU (phosphoserine phosphatase)